MLAALASLDRWVTFTRPAWDWVGHLAVVVLGVHLAADRVDDRLAVWLAELAVAWPEPETPLVVATWCAIAVELAVCAWAAAVLVRARAEPVRGWRAWRDRLSVTALLAPVLVAATGLAGAWVVQMAVEDLTAPFLLWYAPPLAWTAAILVAWRFAVPATVRVACRLPEPRRRLEGLVWAPVVLPVAILAVLHGLPIWGWSW